MKDNETNRKVAQSIATQIELDILSNNFDETLEKYRLQPKFVSKSPSLETNQKQEKPAHDRFLSIWLEYINYVKPSGRTLFAHYAPITKWLERRDPKLDKLAEKFIKDHEKLAVRTFNDRLTYLMAAIKWAMEEELLISNPLKGVKKRKGEGTRNPKRKPFSSDEIKLILDALWSDKFSSPYSPTKHSHSTMRHLLSSCLLRVAVLLS